MATADSVATPTADRRLLPTLIGLYKDKFLANFEGIFVFTILLLIGFIVYFCDQKLSFLHFYFIPVLLAGYFMNTRSAVLGSLLSILVVSFFVTLWPDAFYQELTTMGLYLYLVTWGSFLVLTGALVGTMNEQLRERFARARKTLEQLNELQEQLRESNRRLEERNLTLETVKAKVEAVLHYTMDPVVARLVINRQLRNEKREISVLFADLENFTSHMETVPPETAVGDLNRLFTSMEPILTAYKGHLDKYIGDGMMAEFGVPYFSERHCLLATLAGLKMQQRMAQRDFPWKMRVGIANGPALVGLMGSDSRKNYTAIGDTVNLASRLQALCPPGGVCVDERVHKEVERWFMTRRIRIGLSATEAERLEDSLGAIEELMRNAPSAEHCLKAAELCSHLGEQERAVEFERRALELDPANRKSIQESLTQVLLEGEKRSLVTIKGRRRRIAAWEILGLRDPLDDAQRVPPAVAKLCRQLMGSVRLPVEVVLPLEAVEGSIGHASLTAAFSASLAEAMGLAEREQRDVFLAGYLHDIGKRNVPEALLLQREPFEGLTKGDQDLVRSHVTEGERVLRDLGLPVSENLLTAIKHHHERFDGGGYPGALSGDKISLLARIIQIADEYEALTAWRPYRDAWEPRAALDELRQDVQSGKFDPKIGDVFLRMMRDQLAR